MSRPEESDLSATSGPLVEFIRTLTDDPDAISVIEESHERIARAYSTLLEGYTESWDVLNTTVMDSDPGMSGDVVVSPISFVSVCGHHMLPFHGTALVAYRPRHVVTGIGKIPRLVRLLSRRFTIQEHLTRDIVQEIVRQIDPIAAAAQTSATHLCMISRGPLAIGSETHCSFSAGDGEATAHLLAQMQMQP